MIDMQGKVIDGQPAEIDQAEILIVFCRHGETEANRMGIIQGSGIDFPLTECGVDDARRTGNALKVTGLQVWDGLFTSPLKRAVNTARILASSSGVHCDDIEEVDILRERGAGVLEGQYVSTTIEEAKRYVAEKTGISIQQVDNSAYESEADVCRRQKELINFIKGRKFRNGAKILCISHGAYIRLFLKHNCSTPIETFVDNCSLTCVRLLTSTVGDGYTCIPQIVNDTDHLYVPSEADENLIAFERGNEITGMQSTMEWIRDYEAFCANPKTFTL